MPTPHAHTTLGPLLSSGLERVNSLWQQPRPAEAVE